MEGQLKMKFSARKIAVAAITGAGYAALTMAFAPIGYGIVQFRISEILCILPFFIPTTALGLFIGCAVANLFSPVGILDIIFGSLATLLAGLCTSRVGRSHRMSGGAPKLKTGILACAMPVIFNGPIVGAVLAFTQTPDAFLAGLVVIGAQVALGEAVVMFVFGLPLMKYLPKMRFFSEFTAKFREK